MTYTKTISEDYFDWLCEKVGARRTYSKLMTLLYNTQFYYSLPLDENRIQDALLLQKDYAAETSVIIDADFSRELHDTDNISVLEVLIAMAVRIEVNVMHDEDYGDRTGAWFWLMIENLDINQKNSEYNEDYILFVLHRFMNREFEPDGTGSIARINPIGQDARDIHFWQLFNMGLSNLIERGLK